MRNRKSILHKPYYPSDHHFMRLEEEYETQRYEKWWKFTKIEAVIAGIIIILVLANVGRLFN